MFRYGKRIVSMGKEWWLNWSNIYWKVSERVKKESQKGRVRNGIKDGRIEDEKKTVENLKMFIFPLHLHQSICSWNPFLTLFTPLFCCIRYWNLASFCSSSNASILSPFSFSSSPILPLSLILSSSHRRTNNVYSLINPYIFPKINPQDGYHWDPSILFTASAFLPKQPLSTSSLSNQTSLLLFQTKLHFFSFKPNFTINFQPSKTLKAMNLDFRERWI